MAAFLNLTSVWLHLGDSGGCGWVRAGSSDSPLLPRAAGERYRREMLAHGGGKEPLLMVQGKPTETRFFFFFKVCVLT